MTTETVNLFEKASRVKLRFDTKVGLIAVEDLWTLPLTSASKPSLDSIAVELNRQLKGTEESFVTSSKKDEIVKLKFDIVKYIIDVRIEENKAKTEEVQRQSQKAKLDELIARKQDESLSNLPLEELQKQRDALL